MSLLPPARLAACLLLLACGAAQAQYKWTDEQGNVSYGDQAPRNARNVERIDAQAGAPAADALSALPFEVRRAAQGFPVTLYAAAGDCPPCNVARDFLKGRGVPFAERSLSTGKDLDAFRALGGDGQVFTLAVGRSLLRGFQAQSWADTLGNAGYPEHTDLPSGWKWPAPVPLTQPDAPHEQPAEAPPAAEPAAN